MKLGKFKRFTPEDFPDAPEWARSKFFQQLNNVLKDITNALQGALTLEDNLRAEVVEIDVRNNKTQIIKLNQLKRNPIIALLGKTNYFEKPDFTWQYSPDKALTVEVNVSWSNPPSDEVRCTFVFLGGVTDAREVD